MNDDSIVEEIRSYRAAHAARYDNDLDKICIALREKQRKSARKIMTGSPKPNSGKRVTTSHQAR